MAKRGIALAVVSFIAGALVMFGVLRGTPSRARWFPLDMSSPSHLTLSTAAFLSDIALPKVTSLGGKAEFLPANSDENGGRLGYIVHVVVPSLNLATVPKKYLQDKPLNVDGQTITQLAIKQVYYKAKAEFTLKDKDGFVIQKLTGPSETIASGKANTLQNTVSTITPTSIMARTKSIAMSLVLEKCLTCEGE
jgi:hypothetical protein